jgi:hypothetical protein
VKPPPLEPFVKKMASSEIFLTSSNVNANALLVSTRTEPSKVEPAPLAPFVDKTASSEDIYFSVSDEKATSEDIPATTNAPVTASAAASVAAATVISEKTNKINSEVKPAPTTPLVYEMLPSDFSNPTDAPVTASAVVPAAVPTPTEAESNVVPPALSVGNGEAPLSPSTQKKKCFLRLQLRWLG